ncbi:transposase-like protein [Gigaspora margarita]|uniref:Transposase-like protein n=1 Tax=Gigaspora margarita TaxID=4874 RepID=A0A8H4AFZ5_GIGMA|nr:transposase-like protein [Gigaspora margarita]
MIDDLEDMQEQGFPAIINEAIESALNKLKLYYSKSDNPVYAATTLLNPRFERNIMRRNYEIKLYLLAIPAISAPSERLFSKSSSMIMVKRGSLNLETIQKSIALGNW